jgi:transposase
MEMATSQTVLQGEDTAEQGELYIAFELGDKQWKLSCSDGRRGPSRYSVSAGDKQAVLECIGRARARCGLAASAKVRSCYEAGRDGWWLHRWLLEHGVDNIVVDSASIEVNRRARRAKNDRLDADKLLAMLQRYCAGERRMWAVVRAPTVQEEDARRVDRELQRLTDERTSHINRIGSLLVLHNLRAGRIGGRDWAAWWASHGEQVPPVLRVEIEREVERLGLVKEQIRAIEARQREEVASCEHPLVTRLSQLRAIGMTSAWKLDKELFGWRSFSNRRQLGASLGLTPTPYDSGNSQVEQGISKAGNKRLRSLLVELAWSWLRYQPGSALSQWYGRRFATAGKRMRRVGIVALARRLAIALWRYLQHGEIPQGATLKPVAA